MNTKPFCDYMKDRERIRERLRDELAGVKRCKKKIFAQKHGLNVKNDITDLCKVKIIV
jgi:hypothetical protein